MQRQFRWLHSFRDYISFTAHFFCGYKVTLLPEMTCFRKTSILVFPDHFISAFYSQLYLPCFVRCHLDFDNPR